MDSSLQKNLIWAAVAIGGIYLVYRFVTKLPGQAAQALTNTGEAIGSGLYDLLHKNYSPGTYLRVIFEDGSAHAVLSDLVQRDGTFTVPQNVGAPWAGQTLTLIQSKADGTLYALSDG